MINKKVIRPITEVENSLITEALIGIANAEDIPNEEVWKVHESLVFKDPFLLGSIRQQDAKLCEIAVKKNGLALQFVIHQTPEICKLAVLQNPKAIEYVEDEKLREELGYLLEQDTLKKLSF